MPAFFLVACTTFVWRVDVVCLCSLEMCFYVIHAGYCYQSINHLPFLVLRIKLFPERHPTFKCPIQLHPNLRFLWLCWIIFLGLQLLQAILFCPEKKKKKKTAKQSSSSSSSVSMTLREQNQEQKARIPRGGHGISE